MNSNKELTKNIIEGIGFILMVVSILGMLCVLYEVNELNKEVKELRVITNASVNRK